MQHNGLVLEQAFGLNPGTGLYDLAVLSCRAIDLIIRYQREL